MSIAAILNSGVLAVVFYAIVVGVMLTLIYEERDPSTTLAWVLILILIPGIGVLLYVLFGRNWRLIARNDRRRVEALRLGDEALAPIYARHSTAIAEVERRDPPVVGRLINAIRTQNRTEPLPCFDLEIFPQGAEKFARLYKDIESATDHVHLEYFIWEQDSLTEGFCNLLAEKVSQGVEVRVLYDWVGSITYGKRQLKRLRKAGAGVSADAAKWTKLNYRNHRKIAVIDGRVAYTGGMNMGQEYIDGKPRYASWRDTHVRFGGPLVADLQRLFAIRWLRAKRESLFTRALLPRPRRRRRDQCRVGAGGQLRPGEQLEGGAQRVPDRDRVCRDPGPDPVALLHPRPGHRGCTGVAVTCRRGDAADDDRRARQEDPVVGGVHLHR